MFKIKPSKFTEICGWYGMVALILAYALASFGVLSAGGAVFQTLNFTGSIGIMIDAFSKQIIQVALLNIFWASIGLIVLIKFLIG